MKTFKEHGFFAIRFCATALFIVSLLAVDFTSPKDILSITTLHRLTHPTLLVQVIRANLEAIGGFLKAAQLRYALIALAIHLFSVGLLCWRWRILLHVQNMRFGMPRLYGYYLIAFFFNNFLPTNIGGDAARIYSTGRRDDRMTESFAAVFMDRFAGFVAVFILALVAMAWQRQWLQNQPAFYSVLAFAVAIGVLMWILFDGRVRQRIKALAEWLGLAKLVQTLSRFYQTVSLFRSHPKTLVSVFLLSVFYQFSLVYVNWYAAKAVGAEPSFMTLFFIIQITTLICLIPISINGLGVRESFYVSVLSKAGIASQRVLAFQAVLLLLNYVESLAGGLLFLIQKGIQKQRQLRLAPAQVPELAADGAKLGAE